MPTTVIDCEQSDCTAEERGFTSSPRASNNHGGPKSPELRRIRQEGALIAPGGKYTYIWNVPEQAGGRVFTLPSKLSI